MGSEKLILIWKYVTVGGTYGNEIILTEKKCGFTSHVSRDASKRHESCYSRGNENIHERREGKSTTQG